MNSRRRIGHPLKLQVNSLSRSGLHGNGPTQADHRDSVIPARRNSDSRRRGSPRNELGPAFGMGRRPVQSTEREFPRRGCGGARRRAMAVDEGLPPLIQQTMIRRLQWYEHRQVLRLFLDLLLSSPCIWVGHAFCCNTENSFLNKSSTNSGVLKPLDTKTSEISLPLRKMIGCRSSRTSS
jgi:hypothetical protein